MSARNRPRRIDTAPWDDVPEGLSYEKPANEFYRTPPWATDPAIRLIKKWASDDWTILDAGAGDGSISNALIERGLIARRRLLAVEQDPTLARSCAERGIPTFRGDFLSPSLPVCGRVVVMNPPYSLAREFVERAIEMVGDGLVLALLRLGFMESDDRCLFHAEHPAHVVTLAKRPSFHGGGTDATAYAWFVYGDGMEGRWEVDPCEGAPRRGRRP